MAGLVSLAFPSPLTNPPLKNPNQQDPPLKRTPAVWTVSGGTPPYTWDILPAPSTDPIPSPSASAPLPSCQSPILLTRNQDDNPDFSGVTLLDKVNASTDIYAWTTGYMGWVDVRVTDSSREKDTVHQSIWNGEILLYAPDGNLWSLPSSAGAITTKRLHIPTPEASDGRHIWGIAWAPPRHKSMKEVGTSLTCYILNHDALHAARMVTKRDSSSSSVTYPLMVPVVWVPPPPTEDDE